MKKDIDWTLIENDIPEKEGEYLIQFKNGDKEVLYMEEDDFLYLRGETSFAVFTHMLDLIHSWLFIGDLPPAPALPKKEQ